MADNITLNAGSGGAVVAADDITSVWYQRVKLTDGTADSTTPINSGNGTATNALRVSIATDAPLPAGTNNIGDVDIASSALPTGASTEAKQDTGNSYLLNLQSTVDVVGTAVPTSALFIAGTDGTNSRGLKTDSAGELQVDVLTLPAIPAGTNNIGDVDVLTVPAPLNVVGTGTEAAALRVTIATDSTGVVSVDDNGSSLTVDGTVTANLAAGTNNIGDVDILTIAAGDNNIGNVDIVTMPNVTLAAGTNTNEVVGDVAHDAAVAGNPVQVGASHETPADSAPTNRVSADGDATRLSAVDGALFVIPSGPQQWKARLTGSMSDTTVKAAPGAGLSLYIQTVVFSIGAATASSITLEESTTTPVFGPHYLEAISGRGVAVQFNPPIKIAANTLLSATTTGSTTCTLDVYGFTSLG